MNAGSWIVLIVLIAIVVAIIAGMVKKKRAGKSVSCANCSADCHCSEGETCQNVDEMMARIERYDAEKPESR